MPRDGAVMKIGVGTDQLRPLRHLADRKAADLNRRLVRRALRRPSEARRGSLERLIEIALPQPIRLHGMQITVHDTQALLHHPFLSLLERR